MLDFTSNFPIQKTCQKTGTKFEKGGWQNSKDGTNNSQYEVFTSMNQKMGTILKCNDFRFLDFRITYDA